MRRAPPARFEFLSHPYPLAFAHRGAHLGCEENTMAAFDRAVQLGYRYIETDVQASSDGVPVLFHDDTLTRVMGASGRVQDYPWSELSRLRTPGGEALVPLEDALTSFPGTRFNLDAKTDKAVDPMARAIRRCDALRRVCVGSFDVRRTLRLRRLLGEDLCWSPSHRGVAAIWLAGWSLPVTATAFPVVQVPPTFRGIPVVTPRFVSAAHARGIQVHVWTIDEEEEMASLLDIGVDGLMTDRPTVLKRVLEARGQWPGDNVRG
jgi:glycerophosphoryl diester phosphodiesterase